MTPELTPLESIILNLKLGMPLKNTHAQLKKRRGFALLITIVLVAFLVLILAALATFTRVETQVAGNSQQLALARQNAQMALNIAIGQLQKHTGPDQRVTARAEIIDGVVTTSPPTTASQNTVNGTHHWTGVWDNAAATDQATSTPTLRLLNWLVSGNENQFDRYNPVNSAPNLVLADVVNARSTIPTINDSTSSAKYRLLVGAKTANITQLPAASLRRAVVVPEIEIRTRGVPGFDPATEQIIGHYAWWVGDEGVKARVNLIDSHIGESDRKRLQSAQRLGAETMFSATAQEPANAALNNNADLAKIITPGQLAFLNDNTDFHDQLRERWHDITVYSRGVLSDTRHGGLKSDLSQILSLGDIPFRDALRTIFPTSKKDEDESNEDYEARQLNISERIIFSNTFSGASVSFDSNFTNPNGATWAQLRSWFQTTVPTTGANANTITARAATTTLHGISPLIIHARLFFSLTVAADKSVSLGLRPLVVLANPYNATLTATTLHLRLGNATIALRFDNAPPPPRWTPSRLSNSPSPTSASALGRRSFIPSTEPAIRTSQTESSPPPRFH